MEFIIGYGLLAMFAAVLAVGLAVKIFGREWRSEERRWHRNEYHSSADLPAGEDD